MKPQKPLDQESQCFSLTFFFHKMVTKNRNKCYSFVQLNFKKKKKACMGSNDSEANVCNYSY